MDEANCTKGESPRYAHLVQMLTEAERSALRGCLSCTECQGNAWFRKPAKNNSAACFAAHHEPKCPYKNEVIGEPWGDGSRGEAEEIINRGQIIKLDLVGDEEGGLGVVDGRGGQKSIGGLRHSGPGDRDHQGMMHRRLSTILKLLVTVPEFRRSAQLVLQDGREPEPVSSFFRNLSSFFGQGIPYGGYWGRIKSATSSGGTKGSGPHTWLNMEGDAPIRCHLALEDVPALLERARVKSPDELKGMDLLVLKSPYFMRNGKPAIRIRSADIYAMALRRFSA